MTTVPESSLGLKWNDIPFGFSRLNSNRWQASLVLNRMKILLPTDKPSGIEPSYSDVLEIFE